MITVLLALAAAALFALGTVLQQREAMREPEEGALGAGFLLRLARRPVWLAGMAADGLGFIGQAAALGVGRIVVVQPILATTVIFALPLGSRLSGQRIGAPGSIERVLDEFLGYCRDRAWRVSFLGVREDHIELYKARGLPRR